MKVGCLSFKYPICFTEIRFFLVICTYSFLDFVRHNEVYINEGIQIWLCTDAPCSSHDSAGHLRTAWQQLH